MSGPETRPAPGSRLLLGVEPIEVFRARKRTGDGNDGQNTRPDSPYQVAQARMAERAPYAPR